MIEAATQRKGAVLDTVPEVLEVLVALSRSASSLLDNHRNAQSLVTHPDEIMRLEEP